MSTVLSRFDFFCSPIEKFFSHFFLSLCLFVFKFKVTLLIALASVSIVSEACPSHGSGDVLYFFDSDRSERVMSKLHASVGFKA